MKEITLTLEVDPFEGGGHRRCHKCGNSESFGEIRRSGELVEVGCFCRGSHGKEKDYAPGRLSEVQSDNGAAMRNDGALRELFGHDVGKKKRGAA